MRARAKMESICSLVTDGTHDSPKLQPSGVPFIKGKHISQGYVDFATCDFITEADHAEACRRVKPRLGDVLFSNIGSVGDTARVSVNREFSIKNVALFRPDPTKVDPRYFYYLVVNPRFKESMLSLRSGSAQPFITLGSLRGYETTFHTDRDQQRRIASILSAYDDVIENNTQRIAILEEMARRIYEEWFVRFRFPGHEGVRKVESELGLVPEGWRPAVLADILENVRIATRAGDHLSTRRYVPIDCIGRKTLSLAEFKPWTEAQSSLVLFEEDDVLFGAMRAYFHKVCIAPFPGVTRTTCFVLRPSKLEFGAFATMTAFAEPTVDYAAKHAQGATIPYAVWDGSLARMPILQPPDDLLRQFEAAAAPMLAWVKGALARQNNLRATRDLLLPKLISGELDVSAMEAPKSDPGNTHEHEHSIFI